MEEFVTESSCKDEIQSMREYGQLIPVIGRRLQCEPSHDVEIICGARRLFAAQYLNINIAVELRELTDRESIVIVDVENRQRRDWSAYERGRSYSRWLAAGHFESQDELARAVRISPSQVSRLLKMARLPAVVIDAFPSPTDICESWGLDLYSACELAPSRSRVIARARSLKMHAEKVSPRDVFDHLRLAGRPKIVRQPHRHEVVLGSTGKALFRIKHHDHAIALLINKQNMSQTALGRIKQALCEILHDATLQVQDSFDDSQSNAREMRVAAAVPMPAR